MSLQYCCMLIEAAAAAAAEGTGAAGADADDVVGYGSYGCT